MVARILVVDDCADTVEIISTLLRIYGHLTRGERTGAGALDAAEEFQPDIVLLDLRLPDISGFDVGPQLRSRVTHSCYVAALTGLGTLRDRTRTQALGFDHHLLKPVDALALKMVVADAALARSCV